jgi:hypothetical protein
VLIAKEARADGNAIKMIAALTMLFLPGTFLSSVFGMPSLENATLRLYVTLTIPLTVVVMMLWWLWLNRADIGAAASRFPNLFRAAKNNDQESVATDHQPPNLQPQEQLSLSRRQSRESLPQSLRSQLSAQYQSPEAKTVRVSSHRHVDGAYIHAWIECQSTHFRAERVYHRRYEHKAFSLSTKLPSSLHPYGQQAFNHIKPRIARQPQTQASSNSQFDDTLQGVEEKSPIARRR